MVSVIIPIFNVCSYIERGLANILRQTYQDFEVILSDDGSTDGSLEKCREYTFSDPRIHVLHQENQGAGAARNHGIENAKGEFIYFFDIDDEVNPRLLEYCVAKMQSLQVDLMCFGYDNVETTFRSKVNVTFPDTQINSNKDLSKLYIDEFLLKVNGFLWNKFYRKSFLDKYNLRFENQRIQQDEVFNLKCYKFLERAYLSSEILYTYYVYEKGNTRSRFIPERFDIYLSVRQHFENLFSFWQILDPRITDYLNERFYQGVLQCMMFNLIHPDCPWTNEERVLEMKRIMSNERTRCSFKWANAHRNNIEQRLCRRACFLENIKIIRLYSCFFGMLHNIRKRFR